MYRGLNLRPKKERIELSQYRSLQELHANMRIALAAYWPVLALLFVFLAFHQWIIATTSLPKTYSLVDIILGNILMMTPVLLAIRLYHFARHGMPKSPLRQLLWDFRSTLNDPGSMIVIAVLVVFTKVYMDVKTNIPSVVLFSWDETFMQLDRWLHFNVDPWKILQPVLGHPIITFVINFFYNLWFLPLFLSMLWLVFSRRHRKMKLRFLIAFMLLWGVGGNIMAVAFASAGPAFYSMLGLGPDPYTPLMQYLRQANETFPVWALTVQDILWQGYVQQKPVLGGISAFPSMHNALAALFAIAAWRFSRRAGIIMTAYAGLILIGSVHLGWHYAVDGYIGIIMAFAAWKLAGKISLIMEKRPETRRYRALQRKLDADYIAGCQPNSPARS